MGIPVDFTLRLQLNLRIHPNPSITLMNNVPENLIWPALWFEATAKVTPEVAKGLSQVTELPTIMTLSGLATLVLCSFGFFYSIVSLICRKPKRNQFQSVQTKDPDTPDNSSLCPDGCEMNLLYTNTKVQV